MAWTTPKTWGTEVLTSADMNTYLSDNTQYLYDQLSSSSSTASYSYTRTTGDYATSSTAWNNIDNANMKVTLTTSGGNVLVTFAGTVYRSSTSGGFDIRFRYQTETYYPVIYNAYTSLPGHNVSFSLIINVPAGSHQYTMQWRNRQSGITTYLRGSSTSISHFSVQELM